MEVQDIYIYPIKSLGGVRVKHAYVEEKGLRFDRRWMLVDTRQIFYTQRVVHQMALLQVDLKPEGLTIYHKNFPEQSLTVPYEPESSERLPVEIWEDNVVAQLVGKKYSEWFSDMLEAKLDLVVMPATTKRLIKKKYAVHDESVSFADAHPYLLISQASLDDLNSRLEIPVPMDRFRPNIVISGTEPYAEDGWQYFTINRVPFKATKPCARCVVTTIDQDSAIKSKEPLRTLASYRTQEHKVLFGQNLIALDNGEIKIGDSVSLDKGA